MYWDDSFHAAGTVNLDGCNDPTGCHIWDNPVGNNNTINSWWYSLSTTLAPINMTYRRSDYFEHITEICDGDSAWIQGIWIAIADTLYDSAVNFMGCDSVHAYIVVVLPVPVVNLGNDTAICEGQSVILDAGWVSGYTYLWSTGQIIPQIVVNQSGLYTVTVTHPNLCQAVRQKEVYVSPPPPPSLIRHD